MASFSPSEVALTGFGVVRKNPQAVLIWAALIAAFQLGLMYLMVSQIGSALTELQSFKGNGAADGARALTLFGKVGPAYALIMLLSLPYHGVLTAMMNRVVLKPKDSAFGFLRFGALWIPPLILTLVIGMALQPLSNRTVLKPGLEFAGRTLLRVGVALYGASARMSFARSA